MPCYKDNGYYYGTPDFVPGPCFSVLYMRVWSNAAMIVVLVSGAEHLESCTRSYMSKLENLNGPT